MSYPKLKTKEGIITVTPELIRDLGRQLPTQIADMSLSEIISLGMAIRELGKSTTVSRMSELIKRQ